MIPPVVEELGKKLFYILADLKCERTYAMLSGTMEGCMWGELDDDVQLLFCRIAVELWHDGACDADNLENGVEGSLDTNATISDFRDAVLLT